MWAIFHQLHFSQSHRQGRVSRCYGVASLLDSHIGIGLNPRPDLDLRPTSMSTRCSAGILPTTLAFISIRAMAMALGVGRLYTSGYQKLIILSSASQTLKDLDQSFQAKTIHLYSQILKYQIQLARHYSRPGFFRLLRKSLAVDDWVDMRTQLEKTEESIDKDLRTQSKDILHKIAKKVLELQNKASDSLELLMKHTAAITVKPHLSIEFILPVLINPL